MKQVGRRIGSAGTRRHPRRRADSRSSGLGVVTTRTSLRRSAAFLAIVVLLALACSPVPESAEARLHSLMAAMELAAEEKNLRELKEVVSERYADANGNDRDAIVGLLTYHFLRNQTIHLLTRIAVLEVGDDGLASVTAYVAMAGRPIPGSEALAQLRANLYRFDFTLDEEASEWRLIRADWRTATPEDFL